jgi:hypothetical protein
MQGKKGRGFGGNQGGTGIPLMKLAQFIGYAGKILD